MVIVEVGVGLLVVPVDHQVEIDVRKASKVGLRGRSKDNTDDLGISSFS